jgi:hypothetical protein
MCFHGGKGKRKLKSQRNARKKESKNERVKVEMIRTGKIKIVYEEK